MLSRLSACFLLALAAGAAQISFDPAHVQAYPAVPNQQTPTASGKRYIVSGSVINAQTGAPVPRCLVRLSGSEPAQTFTGDDGHFEFKDVLEGRVSISAERPGFQNASRCPMQQVTVSSSTSQIQVKLLPESSLRGHVASSEGEPIEGVQVQVFRRQVMNGASEWMQANSASTDEAGNYFIDNLPAGTYLVHTGAHKLFANMNSVVVDGRHFPDLYAPQFFPNAPDRSSAQPLQVQPGTEAQADFTLTAVPSYSASGSITAPMQGYSATCETPEGEVVSNAFRVGRQPGQFTLSQLPAGACTLRVRQISRNGNGGYAELPVSIESSDVTGLQLNLEPMVEVPIVTSGASTSGPPGNAGANIQLLPRHMNTRQPFPVANRKDNGQVFSVVPGVYRVIPQPFGGNCIGSMTSGSVDLLKSDLTVNPGSGSTPVNVVLRSDCGTISAKVDGAEATDMVMVLAIPDSAPQLGRLTVAPANNIHLTNLMPGDYKIICATDLTNVAYADPEVLKTLEGQKVTVGPNAQLNIQLQLTTPPAEAR